MTFVGRFFGYLSELWEDVPIRFRVWLTAAAATFTVAAGNAAYDALLSGHVNWATALRVASSAGLLALVRSPLQVRQPSQPLSRAEDKR